MGFTFLTNKDVQSSGLDGSVVANKTLQQAIDLVTQNEFAKAFEVLDTIKLKDPQYSQFKREYTSGTYRNDPHYADRLITFLKGLQ